MRPRAACAPAGPLPAGGGSRQPLAPGSPGWRSRFEAAEWRAPDSTRRPTRTRRNTEHLMRMAALIAGLLLSCAFAGAQPPAPGAKPPAAPPPLAAAQPATEILEFAIMRKGEQIGTHRIELRRTGKETSVSVETNVEVDRKSTRLNSSHVAISY